MQILHMTKAEMAALVKDIYMLMLSEESMYSESAKMAQFMIERELAVLKMKELKHGKKE